MNSCKSCRRPFRSHSSYTLSQRRIAILESLNNGTECRHLMPLHEAVIPKREQHRMDSEEHRAGRA